MNTAQTETWDDLTQIMCIKDGRVHVINVHDHSWDEHTVVTIAPKPTFAMKLRRIFATIVRGVS